MSDGGERYIPQRVPPAAEQANGQENLRAALDVIAGVHRTSKAAQGSAPQNRAQKITLDQALRVGEDKLLRRWATSAGLLYNLNYYGTWLSYFHNLLVHNWLFPETGYTFLGLMDVDDVLQSVVSQKALRGVRGATPNEVTTHMVLFDFIPLHNNDYINRSFGIVVTDLHHRNVLVRNDGELLVFDPVIYLQ